MRIGCCMFLVKSSGLSFFEFVPFCHDYAMQPVPITAIFGFVKSTSSRAT
jgi:hypothetical protein